MVNRENELRSAMEIPLDINKVKYDTISRLTKANDAGFYRLIPEAIVYPGSENEIIKLLHWAKSSQKKLTFRAAGTSLSGQSVTDGVQINLMKGWKEFSVLENGNKVRTQPAVIGGRINTALKIFNKKLGPDPASINSCTMGGILANNSSGMCSGVTDNPFNSILSLRFILPSGTIIDTANRDTDLILEAKEPDIYYGLEKIRKVIFEDERLVEKIKHKYRLKNTIGYSLNVFINFKIPSDILAALMTGSEGTLGFISDAVLRTVNDYPLKSTGFLLFNDLSEAGRSLLKIKNTGASAIEIMDDFSLRSVLTEPGISLILKDLRPGNAGILYEGQFDSVERKNSFDGKMDALINNFHLLTEPFIAENELQRDQIWKVRQGLLASIGGMRPPGTTLIIEDTAFDIIKIPHAIFSLRQLFEKYGFNNASIYGHGMDGNLHFLFPIDLSKSAIIEKYDNFMTELSDLVVDELDGSLKAEHGTGRNMAPFVEKEWGSIAYGIMKKIKKLIDPNNILNPGVIINDDPKIHIKNLKQLTVTGTKADSCIDCGFCESICPSREFTITPRNRITLFREFGHDLYNGLAENIQASVEYNLSGTCAVDGLCQVKCPVGINTGELVKDFRKKSHTRFKLILANFVANNFRIHYYFIKYGLRLDYLIKDILNFSPAEILSGLIKRVYHPFPVWNSFFGRPAKIPESNSEEPDFIYFPTCISSLFGGQKNERSLPEIIKGISKKAGFSVYIPDKLPGNCCGQPFNSKGYYEAGDRVLNKTLEILYKASSDSRIPVIIDMSSCYYNTITKIKIDDRFLKYRNLRFIGQVEYAQNYLLPNLNIKKTELLTALHINCSEIKLGNQEKLKTIIDKCCENYYIHDEEFCCGFAGDRGMIYPDLTKSAIKDYLNNLDCVQGFSTNIPCESGLKINSGIDFRSILYLIEKTIR